MRDAEPPRWVSSFAGISLASTVYAAISFSVGGVLALVAHFVGANLWQWFGFGSCIPPGPLYHFFSSDYMMEKKLIKFREWKEKELITNKAFEDLRSEAIEWYKARHFGKGLPRTRKSPADPKSQ